MGFVWVHGDSFLHSVASPFHSVQQQVIPILSDISGLIHKRVASGVHGSLHGDRSRHDIVHVGRHSRRCDHRGRDERGRLPMCVCRAQLIISRHESVSRSSGRRLVDDKGIKIQEVLCWLHGVLRV